MKDSSMRRLYPFNDITATLSGSGTAYPFIAEVMDGGVLEFAYLVTSLTGSSVVAVSGNAYLAAYAINSTPLTIVVFNT
jgi:hypothetical protein